MFNIIKYIFIVLIFILIGCVSKHNKEESELKPRSYDIPEWAFHDLDLIPEDDVDDGAEKNVDMPKDTGGDNE